MTLAPRIIAVSLVVSASLWSLAVTSRPGDPFGTDAAILVSLGLVFFAVIAAVGLLLPRGRWARNLGRALLLWEMLLAVAVPLTGWAIVALVSTAVSVVGIQGKWLDGWLRRLPTAEGPGLKAMLYALGGLGLVPLIGLAAPGGVDLRQGVLGAAGIFVAWGYSKAQLWAVWTGRLLIPAFTIFAMTTAPRLGAVAIAVVGVGMTYLAWSKEVRLAISPLIDDLPGPRRLNPKPEGNG